MDWERTLNIFIIAFLILNLALAVQLWLRPIFFNPANYISAEEIAATKSELEDRNITVIPKIPRRMKRLQPWVKCFLEEVSGCPPRSSLRNYLALKLNIALFKER